MYSVSLMRCSLRTANQYFLQPVRKFKSKRTLELEKPQKAKTVEPIKIEGIVKESKNINPIPKSNVGIGRHIIYTAVSIPVFFTGCAIWHYEEVKRKKSQYHNRSNTLKLYAVILLLNGIVFLLLKTPPFTASMRRFFLCSPTKDHSVVSLTLSAFGHYSLAHLIINMFVMGTVFRPLCVQIGREETVAVYLAGGTFAGLTSCIYRAVSGRMIPSIGASGAIFTLFAIASQLYPNLQIGIDGPSLRKIISQTFLNEIIPLRLSFLSEKINFSFSVSNSLIGLVILDCVGILRGWQVLDHAAHLGGVLFGLMYIKFGNSVSKRLRKKLWKQYALLNDKLKDK